VISTVLCALLDDYEWVRVDSSIIDVEDPLKNLGLFLQFFTYGTYKELGL